MSAKAPLGVVTGLLEEAAILAPVGARVRASGARPGIADRLARALADQGAQSLVSFGMAGGLSPTLRPGTLLLPRRIVAPDGTTYRADEAWRATLAAHAGAHEDGAIAGSDAVVRDVAAKAALHRLTGAVAVDMESHEVAAIAAERGLPFLAVRAIADPWNRAIPSSALAGVSPDGARRPAAVMAALAVRPWQIVGLLALARDAGAAKETLRRVTRLGAGALGV